MTNPTAGDGFYPRWIAANGWSEALGLGTTFLLGRLMAPALERNNGLGEALVTAVTAIGLGIVLEGALVGWAQSLALRVRLPALAGRQWVTATMAGAGIAWLLGMIPSTIMSLQSSDPTASPPEIPPGLQYLMAAGLGAVSGPILGSAQWFVLRRYVPRAGHWLWANALAWAIGMPLIFAGMDLVPWSGPVVPLAAGLYLVTGGTGLVVGAIHGRVMAVLTEPRPVPAN